jgi:CheY-like chemotaxis protein
MVRLEHCPVPDHEAHTVIVAEDEILIRLSIALELREAGFHVVEAGTADEVLDFLMTGQPVDCVFTDVRMPGALDGAALAYRIARDFPQVEVLVTSAHARPEGLAAASFIPKPYVQENVVARITAAIASS